MLRLSLSALCLSLLLLVLQCAPASCTTGYSSFYTQAWPWNAGNPISPLFVTALNGSTAGVYSNVMQLSPFQSVYAKNVTIDAVGNLAFPFTGTYGSYQDIDTGIDVAAGGQVTFYIPVGYTGGQWCFELGREGAGSQFCSGPQGAWFTDPNTGAPAALSNDKINGAYVSNDPLVPYYKDVTNPSLGYYVFANTSSNQLFYLTQYGTNRGFVWTRSGSVVFRIGARGSAVSSSQYNFNEPTTDYDSAFDSTDQALHPAPTVDPTVGLVGRAITTPVSGRLWLACWRWNLWPQLNYGQVWTLINYTSPVQLAVNWSTAATGAYGSSSRPAIVPAQPIPTPLIAVPNAFAAGTTASMSLSALLPVENITVSSFTSAQGVAPLLQSSFSYHYANIRTVPAVFNGPVVTSCCYGGASGTWNYTSNTEKTYDGLFTTVLNYNNSLAFDMTHVLDSNSSTPFLPAAGGPFSVNVLNMWYPQGQLGSYFLDVDTGISVLEGGMLTITAPIATWCFPTYRNNASQLCSDARGVQSFSWYNTTQSWLHGCDNYQYIFPNASSYNLASYDNDGCNSGSISNPPNGALLMRVGSNDQGHSPIDYAPVFTNLGQTGTLTTTVRAPASGRLYFAAAVMWNANVASAANKPVITQTSSYGVVYTGNQFPSVSYTPPAGLSFAFTWSPASSGTPPQPYPVAVPAALTSSALTAAGYTLVSASSAATASLGVGQVTGQAIYYVLPQTLTAGTVYTATFYAYMQLAEADSSSAFTFTGSSGGSAPSNSAAARSYTAAAVSSVTGLLACLLLVLTVSA